MPSRLLCCSIIGLVALPSPPAAAQPASFHGPIAGFVYSPDSRTLRPLLGIPGSTYAGSPVWGNADSASIAPGGKWAWVENGGRSVFLHGLSDLTPAESSADGLIDAIDRVVWSSDASVAVVYSSSGNQLQRVRLSASTALADAPVDVSSWGKATALAIDPAGHRIAAGFAASGLYLFDDQQPPALLSSMTRPAAVAFDETGDRLYAVDLETQRILEFDPSGASEFASLAQPEGPAPDPVGLAVSGGSQYLLLADGAARSVRVFETASRTLADTITLDFAPSRMEPLSAGPTFLLNGGRANEWLLILDARRTPGVYFVPAIQEESR